MGVGAQGCGSDACELILFDGWCHLLCGSFEVEHEVADGSRVVVRRVQRIVLQREGEGQGE